MCLNGAEDIKHIFFSCDQAKEVWRARGIWDMIAHLLSGSVVLEEVIRKEEQVRLMDVGLTELILIEG